MIIEQPSKFLRWIYPSAIWRMNPNEKAVYLTFDDGPIPQSTPWIIETLDKYGIKATFFMVGDNVRKYPELLELIKSKGHRLGNHTFNLECQQGRQADTFQPLQTSAWMDEDRTVSEVEKALHDNNVGCRHSRLQQQAYSR